MTLQILSNIEFQTTPKICDQCGQKIIPYLAKCLRCNASVSYSPDNSMFDLNSPFEGARVAHLSDLHLGASNKPHMRADVLSWWLSEFAALRVDVVVISGDISEKGDDYHAFQEARRRLENSGVEWCVVPGNHDIPSPGKDDLFCAVFGDFPKIKRTEGVELILFDSNAGRSAQDYILYEKIGAALPGLCPTEGRVGREQMLEIEEKLDSPQRMPRLLVLHHHLIEQTADRIAGTIPEDLIGAMQPLEDANDVKQWALHNGVSIALHGHKHKFMRPGVHEGGLVVLSGGCSTIGPMYYARILYLPTKSAPLRIVDVAMNR